MVKHHKANHNHGPGRAKAHQVQQRRPVHNIRGKEVFSMGDSMSPELSSFVEAVVHPFGDGAIGATYPDNRQELVTGLTDRLELDLRPEDFNHPTAIDQRTSVEVEVTTSNGTEKVQSAAFSAANWLDATSDCQLTGVFFWIMPRCLASGIARTPPYKNGLGQQSRWPEIPYVGLARPNATAPHFTQISSNSGSEGTYDQSVILDDYCLCFTGVWRVGGTAMHSDLPAHYVINGSKIDNPYYVNAQNQLRTLWASQESANRPVTYGFYQGANILLHNRGQQIVSANEDIDVRKRGSMSMCSERIMRRMRRCGDMHALSQIYEEKEREFDEDIEMCDKYSTQSFNSYGVRQGVPLPRDGANGMRGSRIADMEAPIKKGTNPQDKCNWTNCPMTVSLLKKLGLEPDIQLTDNECVGLPEHPISSHFTAIRFSRFANIASNCSKMRLIGAGLKVWPESAPLETGGYAIGGWLTLEDIMEAVSWETQGADNSPGYFPYPAEPSALANIQSQIRFPERCRGIKGATVRYSPLQDIVQLSNNFPTMPERLFERNIAALTANNLSPPVYYQNTGSDNSITSPAWAADFVRGSAESDMNKSDQMMCGSYVPCIFWSFNAKDEEVTQVDENGNATTFTRAADDGIYTLKIMAVAHSEGVPNGTSPFQSMQSNVDPLCSLVKGILEDVNHFPVAAEGNSFKSFFTKMKHVSGKVVKHLGGSKAILRFAERMAVDALKL